MDTVKFVIPAKSGSYKEVSVYIKSFVAQKMRDLGLEIAENGEYNVNAYSLMKKDVVACVRTPSGNQALIHELFEVGAIDGFYISTDGFGNNFGYSEQNIAFAVAHYLKEIAYLRQEMSKEIAYRDEQISVLRTENDKLSAQVQAISEILYEDDDDTETYDD